MSETKQAAAPMRRSLRILLVVSLALNLAVVGVIGGALLSGRDRHGPLGGFDVTLGPFARALSREDRAAIAHDLRSRPDLGRPARGDRKAAFEAFLTALEADPFNPAAISAIFDGQRDRALRGMTAGQEVLLDRITTMSPAARIEFAERLRSERDNAGPPR